MIEFPLVDDDHVNSDDADHLIRVVLDTGYGNIDLDKRVSLADLGTLATHYQETGVGWAEGDLDWDGQVSLGDLATFFGFDNTLTEPIAAIGPGAAFERRLSKRSA